MSCRRGFFRLFLEIDFVAAGAERGCGRMAQSFNGLGLLLVDVDQLLIENAEDAVEAAVNFLDALMFAGFLKHAGEARVNDGGRAT